jgi:integrase
MNREQAVAALRNVIRFRHMSIATERSYIGWLNRYMRHCEQHPAGDSQVKITGFLSHLATRGRVSQSTQRQALNALVFFYRNVLDQDLGDFSDFARARKPHILPVVLSTDEISTLLQRMDGMHWLIASTMYGGGLRLNEALSLRVQDVDFDRLTINVRQGKGAKDRATLLPPSLVDPLREQIARVERLHERDTADGFGDVYLVDQLREK